MTIRYDVETAGDGRHCHVVVTMMMLLRFAAVTRYAEDTPPIRRVHRRYAPVANNGAAAIRDAFTCRAAASLMLFRAAFRYHATSLMLFRHFAAARYAAAALMLPPCQLFRYAMLITSRHCRRCCRYR